MLKFFKSGRLAKAIFTSAASLFTVVFIVLLIQFTESQEESRGNWEEAARTFNDATPNIDIIYESLRPGVIPEYLLFATHDNQENYFYIAADAAKAPLAAVKTLQATFRGDSPAQPILEKLHAELTALSELPLTDSQLIDKARELLFFDPSEMHQVYAEVKILRGLARESVRELEARGIAAAEKLSLFILAGWAAVLLAIVATILLIVHLSHLEKIADQGRKDAERRLALEQEAQEASSFAAKLFEALPVSVVTISDAGIIQSANSATTNLLGYSVDELRGKKVNTLMPKRFAVQHDQYLENYEKTGVAKIIGSGREVMALTSAGQEIEVHLSVTEFSQDGRKLFAGIIVDMSELVRQRNEITDALAVVEATNNRLNQALDFAGMWLFEENLSTGSGKVLRSQHTHEDEEFLVGPARLAATDEEYRSKITDTLSRTGEAVDFPLNFSDSSRKWVRNMTIDEYTDSSGDRIRLQISEDITEFREQQLALEEAVKALSAKNEKQAQMFSIIGHELRTPLSSMKMMEEAMGLRDIGEYGANICESTDAVLNIIDDLRTVVNPDKAHLAQAVVDSPFDVLSRTTKSLEGLYEQQGVEVTVTSNQLAHSLCNFNAQALRQKITNLTKNAAIHADAEKVWVDLQAQPHGDDQIELTLTVEDNGKGIPEALRATVFGAFSRGDTVADGTGLGLYITRELAEKLGGTVEYFESEKGGAGFKVDFTLDLHLDANEQEQVDAAIPVALQGKHILFAEDQKTLQLLTSKLLKDAGAEVVVCDNGKQALDAFRAGEFDIVLTDLMMPEMSGDELIRHICADGFTGQVVALTAAIIGKETDRLLEAGADAVLNKPLDIHAMKRTIAGLAMKGSAA